MEPSRTRSRASRSSSAATRAASRTSSCSSTPCRRTVRSRLECQYNTDLFDAGDGPSLAAMPTEACCRRRSTDPDARFGELPMVTRRTARAIAGAAADGERLRCGARHARPVRGAGRADAGAGRPAFRRRVMDAMRELDAQRQSHRAGCCGRGACTAATWSAWRSSAARPCSPRCWACSRPAPPTCRSIRRFRPSAWRSWSEMPASRPGDEHVTLAGRFDLRGRPVLALDTIGWRAETTARRTPACRRRPGPAGPVAYVIYTSGSTGKPKGVLVPHRRGRQLPGDACRRAGPRRRRRAGGGDHAVLRHRRARAAAAAWAWARRSCSPTARRRSTAARSRACSIAAAATVMQATPVDLARCCSRPAGRVAPRFKALCGGEALPPDLAQALLERSGEVWNMYGPTETTVWSTLLARRAAASSGIVDRPADRQHRRCGSLDAQRRSRVRSACRARSASAATA